jgi:hypothetical protein
MARYLKYLDFVIFPVLAIYAVHLFTWYGGVGISPDSIMYTSAARSLHNSGSLITFNNTTITDFPVFYPVFLWFELTVTGIDPFAAGAVLNQLIFAAVVVLTGLIILRFRPTATLYRWLILATMVLSPALLEVYSYLWSETLFILIILVFFFACHRYFQKRTILSLMIFALVAALSSITRYAGVTLIGTGGLLLLLDLKSPYKRRIQDIFLYGFVSISFLVLNLVRNITITGRLTGPREASFTPFSKNVYYFGTVICDWLGLSEKSYNIEPVITYLLFAGLIALLVINFRKKKLGSFENIAVTFAFVYGAFIIISSTFSRYERINSRLLSPVYIALLLSCTYWIVGLMKSVQKNPKYILTGITCLLMLGFCYQEYLTAYERYDDEGEYGVPGYTDDSWNKSQFAEYLKKDKTIFKPGVPIYSDANEALYFLSGDKVKLLPHRYFKNTIQHFYKVTHYYLVWFNDMDNPELISLKDIQKVENLKLLKQFPEGAIYEYENP